MINQEIFPPADETPKAGLSRNALKYIAILAMVIDHTAHAFMPEGTALYIIMRFIGRITGPVMFFAAAEGCRHTKNINRYMARLAVFALLSYFPYVFFVSGGTPGSLSFARLNVIYTILLGVAAIRIRRELQRPAVKMLLIVGLFILSIPGDWGATGLIMMLVFDYFHGNFRHQAFVYCLVVLLYIGILQTAGSLLYALVTGMPVSAGNYVYTIIGLGMFLPMILLRFYSGEKGSGGGFSKWFFYIFYPLHLLLLSVLKTVL